MTHLEVPVHVGPQPTQTGPLGSGVDMATPPRALGYGLRGRRSLMPRRPRGRTALHGISNCFRKIDLTRSLSSVSLDVGQLRWGKNRFEIHIKQAAEVMLDVIA